MFCRKIPLATPKTIQKSWKPGIDGENIIVPHLFLGCEWGKSNHRPTNLWICGYRNTSHLCQSCGWFMAGLPHDPNDPLFLVIPLIPLIPSPCRSSAPSGLRWEPGAAAAPSYCGLDKKKLGNRTFTESNCVCLDCLSILERISGFWSWSSLCSSSREVAWKFL